MPDLLIVDDDESLRILLRRYLAKLKGCHIKEAGDGESALKKIREKLPELIILDVMMPGMNGIELCRKIKGNPVTAEIYVILLTAGNAIQDKDSYPSTGADDCMTKPFKPAELLARVSIGLEIAKGRHKEVIND